MGQSFIEDIWNSFARRASDGDGMVLDCRF